MCNNEGALVIVCWALVMHSCFVYADYPAEIYAGSPCRMEDGGQGVCVPLPECPTRVRQVVSGQRFATSPGRCSFDGHVEIVCCADSSIVAAETSTVGPVLRLPSQATTNDESNVENPMDYLDRRSEGVDCQDDENEVSGGGSSSAEDGAVVTLQILSGENASFAEFPYMVALGYANGASDRTTGSARLRYNCGGTLVSARHVLTAAHCVSNINNYVPVEAKLGVIDLSDDASHVQTVPVGEIVVHPRYKRNMNYNDVAIVKLRRAVTVTRNVRPICLQSRALLNLAVPMNQQVVASGWGIVSNFEDEGTMTLQKTPGLRLIDRAECARSYTGSLFSKRLPRGIDESMICVIDANATRRSDTCQGDSGGPLLLVGARGRSRLIGVTSFGRGCGSDVPAIYMSVNFYLDWIRSVVFE